MHIVVKTAFQGTNERDFVLEVIDERRVASRTSLLK